MKTLILTFFFFSLFQLIHLFSVGRDFLPNTEQSQTAIKMIWNWLLTGNSPIYTWEAGLTVLILLDLWILIVDCSGRDTCNILRLK